MRDTVDCEISVYHDRERNEASHGNSLTQRLLSLMVPSMRKRGFQVFRGRSGATNRAKQCPQVHVLQALSYSQGLSPLGAPSELNGDGTRGVWVAICEHAEHKKKIKDGSQDSACGRASSIVSARDPSAAVFSWILATVTNLKVQYSFLICVVEAERRDSFHSSSSSSCVACLHVKKIHRCPCATESVPPRLQVPLLYAPSLPSTRRALAFVP